jgi:hypothetical protein
MKALEHCIELELTGPIDVGDVAKGYLDHCVNYALNHRRSEYALRSLIALGSDILVTGGAATVANTSEWVTMVASEATNCLTESNNLEDYLGDALLKKFSAQLNHESHWRYWDL